MKTCKGVPSNQYNWQHTTIQYEGYECPICKILRSTEMGEKEILQISTVLVEVENDRDEFKRLLDDANDTVSILEGDIERLEDEKREKEESIEELENNISKLEEDNEDLENELGDAKTEISDLKSDIRNLTKELKDLEES